MRGWVTPPTSSKEGVVLLRIIFLNAELKKPRFLRDEMIFMHCSLQIKQNLYSIKQNIRNDFYAMFATNKAKNILN